MRTRFWMPLGALSMLLFAAACTEDGGTNTTVIEGVCGNGLLDEGEACDDGNAVSGDGCNATCTSEEFCGNGVVDGPIGEQCDDGNAVPGDGCSSTCTVETGGDPVCGNGVLEAGEQCDDGGTDAGDGCDGNCQTESKPAVCGDGEVDNGEGCDDGNTEAGDGCDDSCQLESCGDGQTDTGEECDDGNEIDTDACPSTCKDAFCGDGFVQDGEEACDDGNTSPGDGCDASCEIEVGPFCGDGNEDEGEGCDDGNKEAGDGCSPDCVVEACGNGILDPGEVCEDGNAESGDGCSADCKSAEVCGNDIIDEGEGCDDGNKEAGDGCSANCTIESVAGECGDGELDPGEGCDDSNTEDGDGCGSDCLLETCGDGDVDAGETCDDGNDDDTDGCPRTCQVATCGDTFVQAGVEQCDDGNLSIGDGCSASCRLEQCGNGVLDPGETCDDSNTNNNDACPDCTIATCGDGYVHEGVEQCDDGNQEGGDGCSADCRSDESCGNNVIDPGEVCDDGNTSDGDACPGSCEPARCGDGYVWKGVESCDDGNNNDNDGCSSTCVLDGCGSGSVQSGEECDEGSANGQPGSTCFPTCISTSVDFDASFTVPVDVRGQGQAPSFLVGGDLNGDGRQDIVVSNTDSYTAAVLYGFGDGRLWAPHRRISSGAPVDVVVADVNKDGTPDVITAQASGDTIGVYLGNGYGVDEGAYSSIVVSSAGQNPQALAVADIDGDTNLDVVTANYDSDNVSILLGDGTGAFTADSIVSTGPSTTGDGPRDIAVADMNGDSILDIVTSNILSDDVSVILASSAGVFDSAQVYTTRFGAGGDEPVELVLVDINNDTYVDVITANRTSDDITVLTNTGDGSLRTPLRFSTLGPNGDGLAPNSLAVGDVTGDAVLDVVTANADGDTIAIFTGELSGANFVGPEILTTRVEEAGDRPFDVAIADLNGDAVNDIITLNATSGDHTVYLGEGSGAFSAPRCFEATSQNTSTTTTARAMDVADLNGDGTLDTANVFSNELSITAGIGDGLMAPALTVTNIRLAYDLDVGDMNDDGKLDWLAAEHDADDFTIAIQRSSGDWDAVEDDAGGSYSSNIAIGDIDDSPELEVVVTADLNRVVTLFDNNGSGSLTYLGTVGMGSSGYLRSVILEDIDGNQKLDLVGVLSSRDEVVIREDNGPRSFDSLRTVSTALSTSGQEPVHVIVDDVDGDTNADILTANAASNDVSVLLGAGSGSFEPVVIVPATFEIEDASVNQVRTGDFNGDGLRDIATVNVLREDVSVILGFGDGNFASPQSFPVGTAPNALWVADYNGDGLDDIAVTNSGDDTVTVLLSLGHP